MKGLSRANNLSLPLFVTAKMAASADGSHLGLAGCTLVATHTHTHVCMAVISDGVVLGATPANAAYELNVRFGRAGLRTRVKWEMT